MVRLNIPKVKLQEAHQLALATWGQMCDASVQALVDNFGEAEAMDILRPYFDKIGEATAARITDECLSRKVFVCRTQGNGIRIFPALNIERKQLMDALSALRQAIEIAANEKR